MSFERGWQYEDAQVRALRRLAACAYTARAVAAELVSPKSVDAKADLLIAAEDLYLEAERLVAAARAIAWGTEPEPSSDKEMQAE